MQKLQLLIKTMRKFMPQHRRGQFILVLLFSTIARILWLISPFIVGKMINLVQEKGLAGLPELKIYVLLLIFTPIVAALFHGASRIREQYCVFDMINAYKVYLFDLVTQLNMQRHQDNHSGSVIDRINKATNALSNFGNNISMYTYGIMNFFGSLGILLRIEPSFFRVLIGVMVLVLLIIWRYDKKLAILGMQKNEKEHKVSSLLFDYLSNIKTLITLRFQSRAVTELDVKAKSIFPTIKSYAWVQEMKRSLMGNINGLMSLGLTVWYIYAQLLLFGTIKLGNVTMILQYMSELRGAFDSITRFGSDILIQATDITSVDSILEEYEKEHKKDIYMNDLDRNWKELTISHLNFSYKSQESQKQTLSDITLRISTGQKIAFVGASGSGKSSMLALLRGLYPVDSVQLHIDDQQFDSLQPLMTHTSLIPQDPEIFENTMRYNITCGLEVEDKKILEYCRLARFDEVLAQLPSGLDTDIKEKGVNLSGGQKQRLALARGLLLSADSDILLLDEPTSSVDASNEKIIFTNILQFFDSKTIIAVMHRLHLLEMFDYIYVFEQGKVIEEGSFASLIQQQGKFDAMWKEYRLEEG